MGVEIERKFKVKSTLWNHIDKRTGLYCRQIYLHKDDQKVIRVRILGDKGFITIKSKQSDLTRLEFEYEIPLEDAKEMIQQYGPNEGISKTRYTFPLGKHIWEIDEFHEKNEGLIIAEIELTSEDEPFEKPDWIGEEVSDDPRYLNANLEKVPFGSFGE